MNFTGKNWDIINIPINNATDTEITFTAPVRSFFLKSRSGSTLYLRKTNGASSFITFPSGFILNSEILLGRNNWSESGLGFWRTDAAGGEIIEGYVIYS